MMNLFLTKRQLSTSQNVNCWTGVVWIIVCFYQLFGLSFWRHPFTAEDPLVNKWSNVIQICSDEETKSFSANLSFFRMNHSLNERLPLCIGADSPFISLLTGAFLNVYNAYVGQTTHSYSVINCVLFSFTGQFITHLHVWMNLIIAVVVLQTDLIWEHFKTVIH